MGKAKLLSSDNLPRTYTELVMRYPPRPLHDKVDYDNACDVVDALAIWDEDKLNEDQLDYLEAVSRFIEDYDAKHTNLGGAEYRGLNALKSLCEDHKISGAELSRILGKSPSVGPKILTGERGLSKENMKVLGQHFKVSPTLFMDE